MFNSSNDDHLPSQRQVTSTATPSFVVRQICVQRHFVTRKRDADWYEREAERIEREAHTAADHPDLWSSYLALAEAYRKLADTLERTPRP